ncbi:MAG TPA: right-handed parallel beta-helix repeat-containing protein [Thermoanaerobaculia bacterium]|nr:right-handed parallel beta-helix repeat-containing protein [Thermoanaerobaculia bacterium]
MIRASALLLCSIFVLPASAATFTVTASGDSGPGTLKAAIDAANANPGRDTILFAVPSITVGSSVEELENVLTGPVDVQGANATIHYSGGLLGQPSPILLFSPGADGSTVRDLTHPEGHTLVRFAATNSVITNARGGVDLRGSDNVAQNITGPVTVLFGQRNRVTNSTLSGLRVAASEDTLLENNLIACGGGLEITGADTILRSNTIHDCTGDAIRVIGVHGVEIESNQFNNVPGKPISLESGGNHLQPHPLLVSAALANGTVIVDGSLTSAPSTLYRIELYANAQTPLASFFVTTGANGLAAFRHTLNTALPLGAQITATATNKGGTNDTSEMSDAVGVAASHHAAVPTASTWALIAMALGLAFIALKLIR